MSTTEVTILNYQVRMFIFFKKLSRRLYLMYLNSIVKHFHFSQFYFRNYLNFFIVDW